MDREKLLKIILSLGFKETTIEDYPNRYTLTQLKTFNKDHHRNFKKRTTRISFDHYIKIWIRGVKYFETMELSPKELAIVILLSELRGEPQRYIFREIAIDELFERIINMNIPIKNNQRQRLQILKERLLHIYNNIVLSNI